MDFSQESLLLAGIALVISLGNLLVAFGQNRLRCADAETHGAELVVRMAERTPALEAQLREPIVHLHEARAEMAASQQLIADLREVVQEQKDALQRLTQHGSAIKLQVDALQSSVQTLKTNGN